MKISKCTLLLFVAVIFCVPVFASAQIIISEFLYDAQGADTDQEYIEIFNAGNAGVDLTKWKINDGSNHVLNVPPKNGGTGSIILPSGAYALLVDNASNFTTLHPGISVSIIDTVLSLPNVGGTLLLTDDSGATADSISYVKDTGGAGDGNSLHRTSIGSTSFATGAPTPGSGTLSTSGNTDSNLNTNTGTTTTAESSSSSNSSASSASFPVEPQIFAYAGTNREVITGADSIFEARAVDKNNNPVKVGRYLWTFGDGSLAEGQTVMHHFSQPGRYAVVLDIADGLFASTHQIIVTATPVSIALTVQNGDIVLTNTSPKNLDLSYWSLRSNGTLFILPKHTTLLGNASVPFTKEVTHLTAGADSALLYPNGIIASGAGAVVTQNQTPAPQTTSPVQKSAPADVLPQNPPKISASDTPDPPEELATSSQVAGVASAGTGSSLWMFGVVGLALLGGGAVMMSRRVGKKEWEIVEET